ncbi:hypothetical protein MMC07_001285 [Pseudocyphellaria aurata]|nr:hypothetical protein [Pseudocyphellaria aurata]
MTSVVLKAAGKHVLKDPKFLKGSGPHEDREIYKRGKPRKDTQWRNPGIPEDDLKILHKVKHRAHSLDRRFGSFGWSGIWGFIPVIGDFIELILALMLVNMAMKVSGSNKADARWVKGKMYTNLAINFGIGLFPVLGDIADIFYRCNSKNADLLEDLLYRRVKQALKASRERSAVKIEKPGTAAHPYRNPDSVPETPPRRDHTVQVSNAAMVDGPVPPPGAAAKKSVLPDSRRFFGMNRAGSAREPDVEKGQAGLARSNPGEGPDTHNSWL